MNTWRLHVQSMPLGWAVFRNYVGHAREIGGDVADYPRFFLMPDSCHVECNSDGSNVIRLGDSSDHIDHEVELVIRLGDDLRPASMCIGCDTTNRTRQSLAKEKSWPWLEGKSFIGSAVLGTWTEWDPRPKKLMLSVNGKTRQSESTELMVHGVDRLLDTLADWYGISPGDYIWTGTPEGVGRMYPGDVIECEMTNSDGEIVSKLIANCEI